MTVYNNNNNGGGTVWRENYTTIDQTMKDDKDDDDDDERMRMRTRKIRGRLRRGCAALDILRP